MLLTIREVSDYLKCHPNTVRRYIKLGRIKPVWVGEGLRRGLLRVDQSELLKLLKKGGK